MTIRLAAAPCILWIALTGLAAARADEEATAKATSAPRLDVVFCVDTTGSMDDEIEVVKQKMRGMVAAVAAGKPTPDVRFGLVVYRDRGDEYVTKRYELTRDIDQVVADINAIVATGGNDYPESVNEALHVAVTDINWDLSPGAGRMLFWIADAPPHLDYAHDYQYPDECANALTKGIVINTIACSGLEEADHSVFQEVANLTGGTADELTYMRQYATGDGRTERVVSAGGMLYELAADAKADEWREGATVLAGRGMAKAGGEGDAGATVHGGVASAIPAAAGPPALTGAPGATIIAESNNLDYLLTKQVQGQLARQGVRFSDQPYLARSEWRGATCEQCERKALVVRTEDEWKRVWALVAEAEGRPEQPPIDFARDMVLAAFGGDNVEGRGIRIADVWQDPAGLHVRVERGTEDAKARAPYHIIVVSRYEGQVIWK